MQHPFHKRKGENMKMIKSKTKIEEVKAALQAFGYPKTDLIELEAIDEIRCKVIYSGHFIMGIYDFNRHTFVD